MIFEQFYLGCLAHASYLIGSDGMAAVVDPQRDVDIYIETAAQHGLRIAHIIETHLHADFVSGHCELARRTGAQIYLGEGSGASFPHTAITEATGIDFGQIRLRFLQTPGHTLEAVSILVTDLERGPGPWAVLTGDTLFIGDVGRPDLSDTKTPQELAGLLYDSLHTKLLSLPDDVGVYPAHGAGSMCGRNISADRNSTIGRERRLNYALQPMTREQFVAMMTADLPTRPEYFSRDVALNRSGASALADLPPLPAMSAAEVQELQRSGVCVLDIRSGADFCAAHVPGSVNVGLSGQFASWAAAVLGLDRELILVTGGRAEVEEARQRLARVGIERVTGFLEGGIGSWAAAGLPLEQTPQISAADLAEALVADPTLVVLDVRRTPEWKDGHLAGATLAPLDSLHRLIPTLDRTRRTVVHCKGGYRSAIACSLLQASGLAAVVNVTGGYDAWTAASLPVVTT